MGSRMDDRLLVDIRGVNLDLLWSRASGTVARNLAAIRKNFNAAQFLGIVPNFEPLGP